MADGEVAADAVPLRLEADEVIEGEHGLVRCVMLNDRMHALTVDTAGEVAVWDVVRGACVGRYAAGDVERAGARMVVCAARKIVFEVRMCVFEAKMIVCAGMMIVFAEEKVVEMHRVRVQRRAGC